MVWSLRLGQPLPRPARRCSEQRRREYQLHRDGAFFAASTISFATSAGRDSIATWLVGGSVVFAFIVLANFRSISGGMIRSLAATTYHVGFGFHAACVSFAPKSPPFVGPCSAASSFPS